MSSCVPPPRARPATSPVRPPSLRAQSVAPPAAYVRTHRHRHTPHGESSAMSSPLEDRPTNRQRTCRVPRGASTGHAHTRTHARAQCDAADAPPSSVRTASFALPPPPAPHERSEAVSCWYLHHTSMYYTYVRTYLDLFTRFVHAGRAGRRHGVGQRTTRVHRPRRSCAGDVAERVVPPSCARSDDDGLSGGACAMIPNTHVRRYVNASLLCALL